VFSAIAEEGIQGLGTDAGRCFCSAAPLPLVQPKSKYEGLVNDAKLTSAELEAATSQARELGNLRSSNCCSRSIKLKPADIGSRHLALFWGCPTSPYRPDRVKPLDLLRNLKKRLRAASPVAAPGGEHLRGC
jgi:hypothetical protein